MGRLTAEQSKAKKRAIEAERHAIEVKNKIFASKLLSKTENKVEEEATVYLSPSQKISSTDLVILSASSKLKEGRGEADRYKDNQYFVHTEEDDPYVFCAPIGGKKDSELIENLCGIANREQLFVYSEFNGTPICVEPNEDYNAAYQRFEKVDKIYRETYSALYENLKKTFGSEHRIKIPDYAKAKKFVKENPQFPFSAELVAYGIHCAKNSNLKNYGQEMPALIRLLGRDAKLTEEALKCLEPGRTQEQPLVFNKDKIKALSENRIQKRRQAMVLSKQNIHD